MQLLRTRPAALGGHARARAATMALLGLLLTACTSGGGPDGAAAEGQSPSAAAPTGSAAPSTEAVPTTPVTTFEGETVSLADYEGTPLVVNFWASWCPPCIAEMPDLEAVHQAAGDQVAFIGINTQDTPEQADDLVVQTGVTYDLLRDRDGALFRAFGAFGMPSTFYVDAEGQVVGQHTGLLTRDALLADLREELGVDVDP